MKKLVNRKTKQELIDELAQETFARRTVSFYRYVHIADPQEMRDFLFKKLDETGCKGRIYVASEGVNAQMNVPEHNWEKFDVFIQSIPEFKDIPYKIAIEEVGTSSFIKLIIKVKKKIVADGLNDENFDVTNTGKYLETAQEVNNAIEDPDCLVVDMRNVYEAEIGHFENAHIMDVDTFREQLDVVEDEVGDKKDQKVLLYCTGGIRCEKASAWMKHKGFKDVYHIKGGIIDYAHKAKKEGVANKFRGKNFVFDERMGERVGDEVIATCHVCKENKCDDYRHCENQICHILFIGCPACVEKYDGFCSWKCKAIHKWPFKLQQKLISPRPSKKNKYFRKHRLKGKTHVS